MIYSPRRHKEHRECFYLPDREMSIGQMRSPWRCIPVAPTSNVLQLHMPCGGFAATKNTESVPICWNLSRHSPEPFDPEFPVEGLMALAKIEGHVEWATADFPANGKCFSLCILRDSVV
jgi:hypothetical protein